MSTAPSEIDIDHFVDQLSNCLSSMNFGSIFLNVLIAGFLFYWIFHVVALFYFGFNASFSLIPSLYSLPLLLVVSYYWFVNL